MPHLRAVSAALAAALWTLTGACSAEAPADEAAPAGRPNKTAVGRPELGLMGTIPIYWGETNRFGGLLAGEGTHWARAELESQYHLLPLDVLDGESLARLDFLLLAQPRALSAAENVALDTWVRQGGSLLLFADPMLTGESRFAIGDRRRPQDVVLLSPILGHWGLELQFDTDQAAGVKLLEVNGARIPVNLPGRFAEAGSEDECATWAAQVLARCAIGAGHVVVLADAALLDLVEPHPAASVALNWLLHESFANAGNNGKSRIRD